MGKGKRFNLVLVAVFTSGLIGWGTSCVLKSRASRLSQQVETKPRETPVPLQPSSANHGKRCGPRVYSDVGADEDYNPFCYQVQRRLVKAAHEGNLEEMRAALRDGANADGSIYNFYYPPLFTAADSGQTDAARLLLDNGSNVNQGDAIHGTSLTAAAGNGHTEVVKLLIERGADVCLKVDGGTAREFAQNQGHKDIVDILKTAEAGRCK
jgi:Ankyrin repeats (many copies)